MSEKGKRQVLVKKKERKKGGEGGAKWFDQDLEAIVKDKSHLLREWAGRREGGAS